MMNRPIQYPIHPIYNDPDFTTTGITRAERHYICTQYYSNQFTIPFGDTDTTIESEEYLAKLITLKQEAFANWEPSCHQIHITLKYKKISTNYLVVLFVDSSQEITVTLSPSDLAQHVQSWYLH
jgi:hypothetical protein